MTERYIRLRQTVIVDGPDFGQPAKTLDRRYAESAGYNACMNFCSNCGARVSRRVPSGDNLPRWVCDSCNAIHYENPRMIVGCVAEWEGRILLCKRAIDPRRGLWTVPAGFLEKGETTAEGAQRETLEEANARVEVSALFSLYNLPHIDQVYLLFRGRLLDDDVSAGAETLETRLFEEADIPWDQLAFATVRNTLNHYLSDRAAGHFGFHIGTISRSGSTAPSHDQPAASAPAPFSVEGKRAPR